MAKYFATIRWQLNNQSDFLKGRYSRGHTWSFDGGVEVVASSSPHVVPLPMSIEKAVDPEESFIASAASCHMLWFLSIAAQKGFIVESYSDAASGIMRKNRVGKISITSITLCPKTKFSGEKRPTLSDLKSLHHAAHENCFIANSIKSEIHCKPALSET
jgi:organic hydroperoxide reductase OsmC/OhrA